MTMTATTCSSTATGMRGIRRSFDPYRRPASPASKGDRPLWSPMAQDVVVNLYDNGHTGVPYKTLPMKQDVSTGTWTAAVPEKLYGKFYTFKGFTTTSCAFGLQRRKRVPDESTVSSRSSPE